MTPKYFNLLLITCFIGLAGCKKFIDIDPPITSAGSATVYTNNAEAAAVLTGIYGKMVAEASNFSSGSQSIAVSAGLSADEFETYSNIGVYHQNLYANSQSVNVSPMWGEFYRYIYVANAALEGLSKSTAVSDSVKRQLNGEAKFIRAFLYFHLVNLWGDVPLILSTDYHANQLASRTASATVYTQIIADLDGARNLLSDHFVSPTGAATTERVRPNKAAATALLARVYLYNGDWQKAEALSTEVINNSRYSLLSNLNDVFLMNKNEAIWQIPPVTSGYNTREGYTLIRTTAPTNLEPVSLTPFVISAFEPGDQRKKNWVDSITISGKKYYYPKKYKVKGGATGTPVTEYLMVFRLAEMYLVRAEAEAQLEKITEARDDLLTLRRRAGLADATLTANDKPSLLVAVMHERRVELFTEWGHRWLDLKRSGNVDAVMSAICPLKGGTWDTRYQLYPIPLNEILNDPNLIQNPGYN
jgi:starch-binding outer membrane protein, SusD/RagB family